MKIFPAIDLFGGKAVRLYKGDYNEMTVYSENPESVALDFKNAGADSIHLVDLEGAKDGTTPNLETVEKIVKASGLFSEIGGGIRSMEVLEKYFSVGVSRAILGTSAVTDEVFLDEAVARYGDRIAVGADVKDGYIAIKGWTAKSEYTLDEFFAKMQTKGVKTVICTDISRDGAMRGTNLEMYKQLSEKYTIDIIASGGVSSLDDVRELRKMNLYGAIIGKAYYTGAIDLSEAIKEAK
ncbi:MAG: 1-(5-phosphoribosyl)-5-[(5-phosphoribosylamino)methylideneamino]imidazole-4-carboxamide isomerase [Ruminococcaceae bacterium]|nr:1-(5-phosphoribosyl)-5-[(5-phosphoribosylamino)methylideneamino]imidazole-4-carboxamide isomerase [Oscillospiraceae bacterium]